MLECRVRHNLFFWGLVVLVVVLAAFKLVVKVVAKPLLQLLRRKSQKPPAGPPETEQNKRNNKKHCLARTLIHSILALRCGTAQILVGFGQVCATRFSHSPSY